MCWCECCDHTTNKGLAAALQTEVGGVAAAVTRWPSKACISAVRWAGVKLPLVRWDRVARYSEVGGAQVLLQLKWVRAGVAKVHCTAASSDESFNILFKYSDFISLQLFWQSMPGLWDKSTTSDHHTPPHHLYTTIPTP